MKEHIRGLYYSIICLCTAGCFLILATSCASTDEEADIDQRPVQSEEEKAPEPAPEPEEPAEQPPESPKEDKEEPEGETYVMDEEEYEETKKDLSKLVSELNEIIASRDYSKWLTYLTEEYKENYSDPEVLKQYSNAPILKKYDIKLRSIKDYFNYVVVASRRNVQVDEIQAITRDKVKAYMYVDGKPVVVYTLEKVDGKWKITK